MQNRTGVIALTIVIALISVYYLSFTFVGRQYQAKATAYATDAQGKVNTTKKQSYIDSLWREKVYLGHTLQEEMCIRDRLWTIANVEVEITKKTIAILLDLSLIHI